MIISVDRCPICGSKDVDVGFTEYDVPNFGKVGIFRFLCNNCLFKVSDVIPLERKEKVVLELKIREEKDLRKIILKSQFSDIYLKEIDVEIYSVNDQGMIFTIENLINYIIDMLKESKVLLNDEKIEEKIEYLKDVLKNKKELTITIVDESGLSKILDV